MQDQRIARILTLVNNSEMEFASLTYVSEKICISIMVLSAATLSGMM